MVWAFVLFRTYVFVPSASGSSHQLTRFAIVNAVSLAIVWTISVGLAQIVLPALHFSWHAEEIAHFIGLACPTIVSYFGDKRFSFR